MDSYMIIIIAAVVSFAVGGLIIWLVMRKQNQDLEKVASEKATAILKEAETKAELIKKDKMMEAKDRFYQLKTEHEKTVTEKDKNILAAENRIKQKETTLNQKT